MHGWSSQLSLVIPDTTLSTHGNLVDFTVRAGFLARFSAMANVHRIIIYREDASKDSPFGKDLETLLKFSVIPPYLRKKIFPLTDSLRFAGLMPPLGIPTHPETRRIAIGDVRVAFVEGNKAMVDENRFAVLEGKRELVPAPPGIKGVTFVRITSLSPLRAEASASVGYSGFYVELTHEALSTTLSKLKGIKIGTSRFGCEYRKALPLALARVKKESPEETFLVFGSPTSDLREILKIQGSSPKGGFDFYVNMDPGQVLKSIRTDEAIPLSLVIINCAGALLKNRKPLFVTLFTLLWEDNKDRLCLTRFTSRKRPRSSRKKRERNPSDFL